MNKEQHYKKLISNILFSSPENIFLYWKGRVALFAILKAMGVSKDDEIIIPAYTCVVVANAIIYLGAKPIYVDIDKETYNSNIDNINKAITKKTKVIICQNTYGLSSNIEDIIKIAKENNLYSIEDCTHGFGGYYNGKPNGSYCDAAFYSTQWNKPFSTGIGGFLLVNNVNFINLINKINFDLLSPTFKHKTLLKIQYFLKKYFLKGYSYWTLIKLYRLLSRHNLVVGSSSGEEINSIKYPKNYFMKISEVQINEGIKNIKLFENLFERRKLNAKKYSEYLIEKGKNNVPFKQFENHSFLKYPLLVNNREQVFKIAEKYKIELGDWLNSPIHPIQNDFELWKLDVKNVKNAYQISKQIINLPTDTNNINKVLRFLDIIENYIIDKKID